MEKEKKQRCAWELVDLDYVVRVDVRKAQNPWDEDVDFEPLEARFVTAGAPVQDLPLISAVPCPDSIELIVLHAKLLLDGLCTARVRGEAEDIEVLVRITSEYVGVCVFHHSGSPLAGDLSRVCRVYMPSLR